MSTPLPIYLAMTGLEFTKCDDIPQNMAWMACHFSPYAQGLSNIPDSLPKNSLLMVNDQTEPYCHNSAVIVKELEETVQKLNPKGVILDFQRPNNALTQQIASEIQRVLPCPVAVTPDYAAEDSKIIFAPPIPPNISAVNYLNRWNGKEIWLEIDKTGITMTVTKQGCQITSLPEMPVQTIHADKSLSCHYSTNVHHDKATFSLYRTEEDLITLLEKATSIGVTLAVGLYQQFYLSTPHHTVG